MSFHRNGYSVIFVNFPTKLSFSHAINLIYMPVTSSKEHTLFTYANSKQCRHLVGSGTNGKYTYNDFKDWHLNLVTAERAENNKINFLEVSNRSNYMSFDSLVTWYQFLRNSIKVLKGWNQRQMIEIK